MLGWAVALVVRGELDQFSSVPRARRLIAALETMRNTLSFQVGAIRVAAGSVGSVSEASRKISLSNQHLSRRTEAQASAVEKTAASLEALTTTVKHNADNAHQADQLAANAAEVRMLAQQSAQTAAMDVTPPGAGPSQKRRTCHGKAPRTTGGYLRAARVAGYARQA